MEKTLLSAFLYNNRLKFNEIEKNTKIKSNKLSYYLKKLIKERILIKDKDAYKLSETSEYLIPYISDKKVVLPITLIIIEKNKKIFLIERQKRPFKNKFSLPGGRMILGESIIKTTERIMKEKFSLKCKFKKINSISIEHVKKNNKIVHSFLLILVTATTKNKIPYINPKNNKTKIISSDYRLIKKDMNKEIRINNIFSRE